MARAASYGPLLDALRGVTWPARRTVRGARAGAHHSRMHGVSPEFTEYRPYRQGDDTRRLDWKLLARTDRAYLRITSDRSTLGTAVIVDASASMAYPPETLDKWEQACRLAVGLASVAHADGDPVGVLVPTPGGIRQLPPRTRRGTVAELARLLQRVTPAGDAPLAPLQSSVRWAGRVVIISDFLGDAESLLRAARESMGAGSEVHAIHVVAREELDPPTGAIMVADPECPDVKRALLEETREEYRRAFGEWRARVARSWRAAGASYVQVTTDQAPQQAIRRITAPQHAGDRSP